MTRTTRSGLERGGGRVRSPCPSLAVISPKVCRRASKRACCCESIQYDRDRRFTPPDYPCSSYNASKTLDFDIGALIGLCPGIQLCTLTMMSGHNPHRNDPNG